MCRRMGRFKVKTCLLGFSCDRSCGREVETCILGFFLRQMVLQTLLDLVRQLLSHLNPSMQVVPLQQHLLQMKSETASFPTLCNSSCRIWIGDCKFGMILQQLLLQMYPRPQVLLPHRGAPSFTGSASCASPSPSWLCWMAKISKGRPLFLVMAVPILSLSTWVLLKVYPTVEPPNGGATPWCC